MSREKIDATAILLAGGNSRRMGREKIFLPVGSHSLIEHIFYQLYDNFKAIIISSNNKDKLKSFCTDIIPDRIPGYGPIMGIASALEASETENNFIIACDIPDINISFIKMMIAESKDFDVVVPVNTRSQLEPLYAIYKKHIIKAFNEVISAGKNKISEVYKLCKVKYVQIEDTAWLKNINTMQDYQEYLSSKILNP